MKNKIIAIGISAILLLVIFNSGCLDFGGTEKSGVKEPTAYACPDQTVYVGETVYLNGTGSDIDGTIILYEWDFDGDGTYDGSSITSGFATHVYNTEGLYVAMLRVTDNDGLTDKDTVAIYVAEGGGGTPCCTLIGYGTETGTGKTQVNVTWIVTGLTRLDINWSDIPQASAKVLDDGVAISNPTFAVWPTGAYVRGGDIITVTLNRAAVASGSVIMLILVYAPSGGICGESSVTVNYTTIVGTPYCTLSASTSGTETGKTQFNVTWMVSSPSRADIKWSDVPNASAKYLDDGVAISAIAVSYPTGTYVTGGDIIRATFTRTGYGSSPVATGSIVKLILVYVPSGGTFAESSVTMSYTA